MAKLLSKNNKIAQENTLQPIESLKNHQNCNDFFGTAFKLGFRDFEICLRYAISSPRYKRCTRALVKTATVGCIGYMQTTYTVSPIPIL